MVIATTIAFTYAPIPSTPIKSEFASINMAGEYTFIFGMRLNIYAKSTITPAHRHTLVPFNNTENKTIRHAVHIGNSIFYKLIKSGMIKWPQ
jgi:hypothetical protein